MNKRGFLKAMAGVAGAVLAGVSFKAKAKPALTGEADVYPLVIIGKHGPHHVSLRGDGKYYAFVSGPSRTWTEGGVTVISTPGPFA